MKQPLEQGWPRLLRRTLGRAGLLPIVNDSVSPATPRWMRLRAARVEKPA